MTFNDDTICAVSTAPGVGGIAVIRVSGAQARQIVDRVWRGKRLDGVASHTAHLGSIVDESDEVIDSAVATVFCAPASFTGDDVVELSVHGSAWIQRETVQLLVRQGCRIAEPGEFTRRAFAAGKLDLADIVNINVNGGAFRGADVVGDADNRVCFGGGRLDFAVVGAESDQAVAFNVRFGGIGQVFHKFVAFHVLGVT